MKSINEKLNKIIQQNNYIIKLLEAVADDAELVTMLRRQLCDTNRAMREIEYEQWMKENLKKHKA